MPAVAGMFYPDDKEILTQNLAAMLSAVKLDNKKTPKAIIAPHAGLIYSGPIAASAYARWLPVADKVKRIIIMAPSHRLPLHGIATTSMDSFRTPLGDIPVDRLAVETALQLEQVMNFDEAFAGEHALEVQLPFLQQIFTNFSLAPFIVGDASGNEVAEVLDVLWGGTDTKIVISSDLSHFLDYASAVKRDLRTTTVIESLSPESLRRGDACGRNPVKGMLTAAKKHALQVETVDLRNSGDTAGDKKRVVGYGAYVFRK